MRTTVVASVTALLVALPGIAGADTADQDNPWLGQRVMNMAHSGGEDESPMNTMYAFEQAADAGADMLELDVQLTADDDLAVIHDATVDDSTDQTGRVADYSMDELRDMDAALPALRQRARPSLRHLADAVGATAHLTVVEGSEAVALIVVEPSTTDFHVAYRTGARHALDRGAAGRAILAARDGDPRLVRTVGDLQQGAHGLAVALSAGAGGVHLEASVGVIALHEMDATEVEPAIRTAAEELAEAT